jgi:magnesium transporter
MMAPRVTEAHLREPVTHHMRQDFSTIRANQTVDEVLSQFRARPPSGRIIYFYVVDEEGRLQGVVPTRRLLLSPAETRMASIMVREVIAIPAEATILDACEFFTLHRLLAFPIMDAERRMIGLVDVELYTEELGDLERAQRTDDLFQLIGVHLSQVQQTSPLAAWRQRFPWLLTNIGGGILAAFLSGAFEDELRKAVALALFIPVVLALAESVSIQSVSLTLEVLHGQPLSWRWLLPRLRTEMLTGLLLGAASALLVAAVALVWLREIRVVLCLLGGIVGGVTAAALGGMVFPVGLRVLNREPQVAAGPIALAAADMVTLLVYFNLARWLLAT